MKRPAFLTSELAELLQDWLKIHSITDLVNAWGSDSVARAAYAVLHGESTHTELGRADMLCIAMGHPEYLQLLTEV